MKLNISYFFLLLGFNYQSFAGSYLEYKMTFSKERSGVIRTWYQNGNSRSEMEIPGVPGGLGNMVALSLKAQPNKIFVLNESSATYMEMADFEQKPETKRNEVVELTVLGQEKVNGYNSTHITIKRKDQKTLEHFWLSKEIKGYKELQKIRGKYMAEDDVLKAFAAKGLEGYPVKMRIYSEEGEINMDLVRSEEMDIPDSKFSLEGFSKAAPLPFGPGGIDVEKLKNMSPEERQKFKDQMMNHFGK